MAVSFLEIYILIEWGNFLNAFVNILRYKDPKGIYIYIDFILSLASMEPDWTWEIYGTFKTWNRFMITYLRFLSNLTLVKLKTLFHIII